MEYHKISKEYQGISMACHRTSGEYHGISMEYHGISIEGKRDAYIYIYIHGIYKECVWNTYEMCIGYAQNMFGRCYGIRTMYGISWNI